ncbi:hypothetical protein AB205_0022970, partial [Aquarana catesbeiana]
VSLQSSLLVLHPSQTALYQSSQACLSSPLFWFYTHLGLLSISPLRRVSPVLSSGSTPIPDCSLSVLSGMPPQSSLLVLHPSQTALYQSFQVCLPSPLFWFYTHLRLLSISPLRHVFPVLSSGSTPIPDCSLSVLSGMPAQSSLLVLRPSQTAFYQSSKACLSSPLFWFYTHPRLLSISPLRHVCPVLSSGSAPISDCFLSVL